MTQKTYNIFLGLLIFSAIAFLALGIFLANKEFIREKLEKNGLLESAELKTTKNNQNKVSRNSSNENNINKSLTAYYVRESEKVEFRNLKE